MNGQQGIRRREWILLFLFATVFRLAMAQSETGGTIAGQVGAGQVGEVAIRFFSTLVTLRNTATGNQIQTLSDHNGNFRFAEVAPGNYTVRFNAPGFAPSKIDNVTVEVGRVTLLTATMSLAVTEQTAPGNHVPRAELSPAVSNNFGQEAVENLPNGSGRWSSLAALAPGSGPGGSSGADESGLSFRGLSPLLNSITVDGADNNLAFHARERGTGGSGYSTAQAAVSEFQVNSSNFSAEYGRAAGGVINTVTRSGGNRLHGQATFYDRDAAWGSGNAFTALTERVAAGQYASIPYRPADTRLQWGFSAGGPLRRDKVFWFLAYEQHRRDFPGLARVNEPESFFAAPSAQEIATLAGRIGQQPSAALETYNDALNELAGLLGSVPRTARQLIVFPKIDWQANNRNHLVLEYNHMRRATTNGVLAGTSDTDGVGSFGDSSTSGDAAIARWEYYLTPNLLNNARYQFSRDLLAQLASTPTAFERQLATNSYGLPPQVSVDRSAGFTFGTRTSLNKPEYPDETRQQFVDAVTWIHHKHAIKFGYDYNHVTNAVSGMNDQNGAYSYSSVLNFVSDLIAPNHCDGTTTGAGQYPCYSYYRQAVGSSIWQFETADYAGFLADDWKISRRFSLSFGVRYEYQALPNTNKLVANADIPQTSVMPHDRNNYGPRGGFFWDLLGSGHTVLRGGYGIYYGRVPNATVFSALTSTGSARAAKDYYYRPLDIGAPPFPYVFGSTPAATVFPNAFYFDKRFQNPQIDQSELSLQQELGQRTTLIVSYLGSYGRELSNFIDTNIDLSNTGVLNFTIDDPGHLGPLKSGAYASRFYYQRLQPNYGAITDITSETNANYQAAVARLTRRMNRAFSINVGYTYSHAIDDNQNASTFADNDDVYDPADLKLERGTSNFDVRQRIAGGIVAHEPWRAEGFAGKLLNGYTLAGSGEWRTGLPYTMRTTGAIPAAACSYEQYLESGAKCASIVDPGVIIGSSVSISGLGASLNGSGGNDLLPQVGRNTFREPGIANFDVRAAKRTALGERASLEILAEAFNVLNHQNVTAIETIGYLIDNVSSQTNAARLTYLSGANGTAAFGGITNANSNALYRQRQIQIGCKLSF